MKSHPSTDPVLIPALPTAMRLVMIMALLLILLVFFGPAFESAVFIREVPERLTTMFTEILSRYP